MANIRFQSITPTAIEFIQHKIIFSNTSNTFNPTFVFGMKYRKFFVHTIRIASNPFP